MIITIDGKTFYNDVKLYYSPDEENPLAGSIIYPLSDVKPGEHILEFTVWDNANNSTTASLTFNVSASWQPSIETLTTDVNPASTSVNFIIATDGATKAMKCNVEVFDLSGRKIWKSDDSDMNSANTRLYMGWDLCDSSGARVARGIYLYRATITTSSGATVTKTKKLAVTSK